MAVYCISDLHGALEEFEKLLGKTGFRFDGSDTLWLLGDYCDWGAEPLNTLCRVMEMDRRYPFVHCLLGNHEQMFLDTTDLALTDPEENHAALNWLWNNRGVVTWTEFLKLSDDRRSEIVEWMRGLPYSGQVTVNGVSYLLGHAYPYFEDTPGRREEKSRRQTDALWRRLMIREDPFGFYEGSRHYDMFLCGHTITEYYYNKLQYEKHWPYRKPDPSVRNRIFHAEKFIDLDCGAKCFGCEEDALPVLRRGAERAQLSALRLDDGHEFYVHPALRHLPPVTVPEMKMPDIKMPDIRMPDIKMPDIRMPDIKMPDIRMPDIKMPDIRMPDIKMPDIRMPGIKMPDMKIPGFRKTGSGAQEDGKPEEGNTQDGAGHP
ncbi:MAG: metallophosphoesterase [Lachnospiraceae bacterium]|jgi:hypothetical protein|nr:metallophosphoesterase [Lachnospiraceae bacterium]